MFHGADTRMTLPLLQSACAVSLLLRFLGAPAAAADTCDARAMQLMARMGMAQEITHAGRVLATWKNTRPARRLDTTALRCAHPEIAEEFTKIRRIHFNRATPFRYF